MGFFSWWKRWRNPAPAPPPAPPRFEIFAAASSLMLPEHVKQVFSRVATKDQPFTTEVEEAIKTSPQLQMTTGVGLTFITRPGDHVARGDAADGRERCELLCMDNRVGRAGQSSSYGFEVYVPLQQPPNSYCYITQFLADEPRRHPNPTCGIFFNPRGDLVCWFKPQGRRVEAISQVFNFSKHFDKWVSFDIEVDWRTDKTGMFEVLLNGDVICTATGQTSYTDSSSTRWKIGQYRGFFNQHNSTAVYRNAYIKNRLP